MKFSHTPTKNRRSTVWSASMRGWLHRAYAKRRRLATLAASTLAIAVGYHVVFGHNGLTAFAQKRSETQSLDRQLRELKRENDDLKGHVERLQTDPDAIEHQAREELHYARPGEVIVSLPPVVASSPRPTAPQP